MSAPDAAGQGQVPRIHALACADEVAGNAIARLEAGLSTVQLSDDLTAVTMAHFALVARLHDAVVEALAPGISAEVVDAAIATFRKINADETVARAEAQS